jgi:hypothetical protein
MERMRYLLQTAQLGSPDAITVGIFILAELLTGC